MIHHLLWADLTQTVKAAIAGGISSAWGARQVVIDNPSVVPPGIPVRTRRTKDRNRWNIEGYAHVGKPCIDPH